LFSLSQGENNETGNASAAYRRQRPRGFDSLKDLLDGLQGFYPNITLDSPVTVIRWKNPQGFLVDRRRCYLRDPQKLYSEIEHE